MTLRPTQLVFATGMSGKPNDPRVPRAWTVFRGDHTTPRHTPGPDAYAGKRAVVIGSNNSAFDICGALWENDADVTMVQRSSTHIVKSDSLMEIGLGALYSEEAVAAGVTTEKADMIFASLPYRIMHKFQIPLYDQMKERDKDFYTRLEKAGFWLDFGEDGSGLFMKYLRRGSGYYIDVGAADLVADGDVKLVHGPGRRADRGRRGPRGRHRAARRPGRLRHRLRLDERLGRGPHRPGDRRPGRQGAGASGSDTTKDPGPWEGEQRNMWKPTQQQALWFHGGNLHQSRHYSLYLALQLKARPWASRRPSTASRRCTTRHERHDCPGAVPTRPARHPPVRPDHRRRVTGREGGALLRPR